MCGWRTPFPLSIPCFSAVSSMSIHTLKVDVGVWSEFLKSMTQFLNNTGIREQYTDHIEKKKKCRSPCKFLSYRG